jgi:hypothetical protein
MVCYLNVKYVTTTHTFTPFIEKRVANKKAYKRVAIFMTNDATFVANKAGQFSFKIINILI